MDDQATSFPQFPSTITQLKITSDAMTTFQPNPFIKKLVFRSMSAQTIADVFPNLEELDILKVDMDE